MRVPQSARYKSPALLRRAVAFLVFGATSIEARAQGVLSGRIVDAVRERNVAAGSEVRILGTEYSTLVDTAGRFTFTDLPAGRYEVAHAGLWLDSLGLSPLSASVELSSTLLRVEVSLSTPSRAVYHQSLCGQALAPDVSALLGDLRRHDATPARFATVIATWFDLTADERGVVRREMRAVATADSTGAYRLCGVPVASNVTIVAEGAAETTERLQTDTLVVTVGPGGERLDLVLGPASPSVVLSGRLVNAQGAAAVGDIAVARRTEQSITVDSLGVFSVRVAPRSTQLLGRSPGFEPATRLIDPVFGPTDGIVVQLLPLGAALDPIRIVESREVRLRREFEERRKLNFQGAFLDDSTLARYPVKSTRVLQANVPRSSVDRRGMFYLFFGREPCRPRLFVDGADMNIPDGIELQSWLERATRIEVYRDTFTPARFADPAGCGAIVLWTQ